MPKSKKKRNSGRRDLIARPMRRTPIDMDKLVDAFVAIAREQAAAQTDRTQRRGNGAAS